MIDGLLAFLEIDDETRRHGRELWTVLAPRTDRIIGDFYRRVQRAQISPHVTDEAIGRLKIQQRAHWSDLFNSRLGEEFAARVRRVSFRHREIALNPAWYVAGYMTLKIEFTKVVAEAEMPPVNKGRLMKALDKFTALDMALALSAYDAVVLD
jgi:hypothetical protein